MYPYACPGSDWSDWTTSFTGYQLTLITPGLTNAARWVLK